MRQIRVAILGDSELENEGLCHVLRKHPDLVPCCHGVVSVRDVVASEDLCDGLRSDVTVMLLPLGLLYTVISRWRAGHPSEPILAIVKGSGHGNAVGRLLDAGVAGILSTLDPWAVASLVRLVHNHVGVVEATMVRRMLQETRESGFSPSRMVPLDDHVWELLARGWSNPQIATACGLSLAQTKHAVHRILHYLGVTSRTQAALAYAGETLEESSGLEAESASARPARSPVSVRPSHDEIRRSVR